MRKLNNEEKIALEICIELMNDLITNRHKYLISPKDLISVSKMYYALVSYPKTVINDFINISTSTRWDDGGLDFSSLEIWEDHFELMSGGSVYTEGVGSDSFTSFFYSSDSNNDEWELHSQLLNWKSSFLGHLDDSKPKISIDDQADLIEKEDEEDDLTDLEEETDEETENNIEEELNAAFEDFVQSINNPSEKVIENELAMANDIISECFEEGLYKFSDCFTKAYLKYGNGTKNIFIELKQIYGAISVTVNKDIYSQMDKDIYEITFESLVKKYDDY